MTHVSIQIHCQHIGKYIIDTHTILYTFPFQYILYLSFRKMDNGIDNSADAQYTITVKPIVTKIVFYNPHEPIMIEFEYGYRFPANEVIVGGISSLCMCNAKWRTAVHARHMKIQVDEITHNGSSKYYLRQITAVASDANTLHICVEKRGVILELPFLCMMQIRSKNFVDCGHLAVRNLQVASSSCPSNYWYSLFHTSHTIL